jgi:hypothetical protein
MRGSARDQVLEAVDLSPNRSGAVNTHELLGTSPQTRQGTYFGAHMQELLELVPGAR